MGYPFRQLLLPLFMKPRHFMIVRWGAKLYLFIEDIRWVVTEPLLSPFHPLISHEFSHVGRNVVDQEWSLQRFWCGVLT